MSYLRGVRKVDSDDESGDASSVTSTPSSFRSKSFHHSIFDISEINDYSLIDVISGKTRIRMLCPFESKLIRPVSFAEVLLLRIVKETGMKPLTNRPVVHSFPAEGDFTHGETAVWVLETSHISYHSFAEKGGFALDMFSCSPYDPTDVRKVIIDTLNKYGSREIVIPAEEIEAEEAAVFNVKPHFKVAELVIERF
jgi:S-adenosylmethionine/arginine decarboxylase-like enzyme